MKCPKCGQEIQAEHLYCENCGMEIRIVPDFEPEIENSITETLSTVAGEIEDKKEQEQKQTEEPDDFFMEDMGKTWFGVRAAILLTVLFIAAFLSIFLYTNYSVSYQLDNARRYGEEEKYEEALKFIDKVLLHNPENTEAALLQARYYSRMGRMEESLQALLSLVEGGKLSDEDEEKVYEDIINIYDGQGRYEEINELLLNCQDEAVVTLFQSYMALDPEYSYASGNYDRVLYLRLSANTMGTIYYTLDGSTPTALSQVYTAPILLESGRYQVNAVFMNDYGIGSNVVRNWYEIDLAVPEAPIITPESGVYNVPSVIEASLLEEGNIYYTTDRSDPTIDSIPYTGPIDMPLGRSNYKFIIISEEGVSSEITSRSYEFNLNTDVSVDMAIANITDALIKRQVFTDTQGHAQGVSGRYLFRYHSIAEINGSYYYIFNEYYADGNGSEEKLERMYAVNVYTGSPNRLTYDEHGQMGLISLTDNQ